ncbi:MAG TPA: hypothetical protein DF383_06070, partial [Deltaproteobacteria bacterium]|nr:hypothetical protein [Deltaproteobacteria bacterium]
GNGLHGNAVDEKQESALFKTLRNFELTRHLIEKGADLNLKNRKQQTLLHMAVHHPVSISTLSLLLQKGADPNVQNESGETPLILAILDSRTDAMELLIKAGAKLELQDRNHKTVLDYAEEKGYSLTRLRQNGP